MLVNTLVIHGSRGQCFARFTWFFYLRIASDDCYTAFGSLLFEPDIEYDPNTNTRYVSNNFYAKDMDRVTHLCADTIVHWFYG